MPLVRRGFSCLLHQLEEVGLVRPPRAGGAPRLPSPRGRRRPPCSRLRPHGHLAPPRLTTMWPISPAAPRPSQGLPSRTRPPPTPVPQKTPIRLRELAPGAEVELGVGRDLDVVADPDRRCRASSSQCLGRAGSCRPSRAGCGAAGDGAGLLVGVARRADADAGQRRRSRRPAASAASRSAAAIAVGDVRRAAAGRRRVARFAEHLAVGVDDRGLDLGAAEVDAAAQLTLARDQQATLL